MHTCYLLPLHQVLSSWEIKTMFGNILFSGGGCWDLDIIDIFILQFNNLEASDLKNCK